MASARPLDLVLDRRGKPRVHLGHPAPLAGASFLTIGTPTTPPYSVNGCIFLRIGNQRGYCSSTAIDSPTRQLVLTAGHCVNAGAENRGNLWYRDLLFVPAYTAGRAPLGAFPARRNKIFAPLQWRNHSNPDFDLGAFLTDPNNRGIDLADAVGGGAAIALDLPRNQRFASFGYPGNVKQMQGCHSGYAGDDRLTSPSPARRPSASPATGLREPAAAAGWSTAAPRSTASTPTSTSTNAPAPTAPTSHGKTWESWSLGSERAAQPASASSRRR
jgi:hypothetical protein